VTYFEAARSHADGVDELLEGLTIFSDLGKPVVIVRGEGQRIPERPRDRRCPLFVAALFLEAPGMVDIELDVSHVVVWYSEGSLNSSGAATKFQVEGRRHCPNSDG